MVNDNTLEGFMEKNSTQANFYHCFGLQLVWTSHSLKPGANLQELTSKNQSSWVSQNLLEMWKQNKTEQNKTKQNVKLVWQISIIKWKACYSINKHWQE